MKLEILKLTLEVWKEDGDEGWKGRRGCLVVVVWAVGWFLGHGRLLLRASLRGEAAHS